jgi:hypothetical protein
MYRLNKTNGSPTNNRQITGLRLEVRLNAEALAIEFKDLGRQNASGESRDGVGKPLALGSSLASFGIPLYPHRLPINGINE